MATAASAQQVRFAEPVALSLKAETAEFDAYGRRFSLHLADNGRVLSKLSAARKSELAPYRLLRGSLDGASGSWVRLTQSPAGIEGAIWDGHEFYAVSRYERIAPFLANPIPGAAPGQTVVYRLSDMQDALPRDFCDLPGAPAAAATALDQYTGIVGELQQGVAEASISRQIEISLIADSAFSAAESADPVAAMLARLNIVEGIFSEQVGLLVLATDVRVIPAANDPFTSTKASRLLDQLGAYRSTNAEVRARGLAHLLTGKNLDGSTAGIAYVGSVCETARGVSLSERSYSSTISALVMAHELGHNFGAPHDGEAGEACATTGGGYLMAPQVSGYSRFSQCSLEQMRPVIDSARCVTPADYADVSLGAASTAVAGEGGVPFTLPFTVRSRGTRGADEVIFTATFPEGGDVSIDRIGASQGNCTVAGTVARCALGALAAGEERTVEVVARGSGSGSFPVRAHVAAANDRVTSNDDREIAVSLRSGVDVALQMSTNAAQVELGSPLEIYADVASRRSQPVRGAMVSVNLNQPVAAASMPGADCTTSGRSVTCTVAEIAAGSARRLTVIAFTTTPGSLYAAGSVNVTDDGDLTNNRGSASGWIQVGRDVEVTTETSSADLGVGAISDTTFTVRSRGVQGVRNVSLWLTLPAEQVVLETIEAGTACVRVDADTVRCDYAAFAAGAEQPVRLQVRGLTSGVVTLQARLTCAEDEYAANDAASLTLRLDNPIDLALDLASGGTGIEGLPIDGQVSVRSAGRLAAENGTLGVELHEAGTLRAVTLHNGAACTILDARHATCPLPVIPAGGLVYVDYRAEFAEPGSYGVTFTAAVAGDTVSDNDVLERAVLVRPYFDVALAGELDLTEFNAGDTRSATFTLRAGPRALAAARVVANHFAPGLAVDAISAPAGNCRVDERGGSCDFTDLAANSSVPVTVTWRAAEGGYEADVSVSAETAGDVARGNDVVSGRAQVQGPTDLELRAGATAAGARGATLTLPAISVANGAQKAFGARLEVTLPAAVTLLEVSASNAICSGTTVLTCDFAEIEANGTAEVTVSVRAEQAGNFMTALKITARNDTNPANDSREMAISISSGAAAPAASPGGGGRMEWLALALLLALALRKAAMPRRPD